MSTDNCPYKILDKKPWPSLTHLSSPLLQPHMKRPHKQDCHSSAHSSPKPSTSVGPLASVRVRLGRAWLHRGDLAGAHTVTPWVKNGFGARSGRLKCVRGSGPIKCAWRRPALKCARWWPQRAQSAWRARPHAGAATASNGGSTRRQRTRTSQARAAVSRLRPARRRSAAAT